MQAGKLRHRITLQSPSTSTDTLGETTIDSWTNERTVWARIAPAGAEEKFQAQQVNENVTHEITIRYMSDITTDWRVKFGDRVFHIDGITTPDEIKHWMKIQAIERAS